MTTSIRYETSGPFITPAECHGQMCGQSYALGEDVIFERCWDSSDRTVSIYAYALPDDDSEYIPHAVAPSLGELLATIYTGPMRDEPQPT